MRAGLILILVFVIVCWGSTVTVDTQFGPIVGIQTDIARYFKGIPFMMPPLGKYRWNDPVDPTPWTKPLETFEYKPGCPQRCNEPPFVCPTSYSEDCIYLNVFSPLTANSSSMLPVMLFWSGGNYKVLSSSIILYESQYFANLTNIVIVTANYRLGALGFLVTDITDGNYGIADQQKALLWVQNNIHNFGGDKTRVTIFGQSAGAGSVAVHLTSKMSFGLFSRAIIQSNPAAIEYKNHAEAAREGATFAKAIGCPRADLECMRKKTSDEVIAAQLLVENETFPYPQPFKHAYMWSPNVGGDVLPEQPLTAFAKGNFAKVPVMLGTLKEEGIQFVDQLFPKPIPSVEYDVLIALVFGPENAENIFKLYPLPKNDSKNQKEIMFQVVTHYTFTCPNRYNARALSNYSIPTYLYTYEHPLSFNAWGQNFSYCNHRVCHGSELPILFNSSKLAGYTPTMQELILSLQMSTYWGNFARGVSGDIPGVNNTVSWPVYTNANDKSLSIDTNEITVQIGRQQKECDMWDTVGYLKY